MEKHESRLTFEEDKPKESKLTYDSDLAKQAAGKAEHSSRLQFDETEMSEETHSHVRNRQGQKTESADEADMDLASEADAWGPGDEAEPEPDGAELAEEPKVKERRSKLGTGSGTGRSRQEAGHADKLSFEGEPEAEETAASQKSKKAARRRPDQRAGQGAGQQERQTSGRRQTGRAGRSNTLSNSARDATAEVRSEVRQSDEDENAGVEGALEGESLAEGSVYAIRDFSQMHKVSSYGYANKLTNDSDGVEKGYQQRTSPSGQVNQNSQTNVNGQSNPNRQAQTGGTSAAHQAQRENIKKEYAVARGGYASAGAAGTAAGTASGSAATAGQAKEAVKDTASATEKAAEESTSMIGSAVGFVKNHAFLICCIIVIIAVVLIVSGVVTSCAATAAEASGSIASTSYLADDDDILQVEAAYCELEQALQSQIDSVESSRPGYDEYKYNVDEIGHSPFELASYLTVRFGAYKLNSEVSAELQVLFDLQYQMSYSVQTETRYRTNEKTGEEEAYEYRVLTVTMKNNGLTSAINQRGLTSDEQEYYQVLMSTYGNRPDIFGDGYYNSYYVEGDSYQVPGEALTDERFARMLAEAEKYLGYPYVWGGSSPSTSFDCSGFVSWVINNCGNGWSVGRQTANGLRNLCTAIPASEAQPGDLIFFQGTYNTSGASHVGIYVGNGMMIHCGNPIKYSSINTSYWQSHFLSFGRLP